MFLETENNIGNLSFQLQYNGNVDGIAIKKTTEDIVEHNFLPALESLLDKHSPPQNVVSIDKLICEINIGASDLNDGLTGKIMLQLEKLLLEKLALVNDTEQPPTIEKRFAETLLYYLENGYLPWWAAISTRQQLNELIIRQVKSEIPGSMADALLILLKRETVVARICNDFEDATFWNFFKLLPGWVDNSITTAWQKDYFTFIAGEKPAFDKRQTSFLYKKSLLKSLSFYKATQLAFNLIGINKQFVSSFTAGVWLHFISFDKNFAADAAKLINKIKNEELKTTLALTGNQDSSTNEKNLQTTEAGKPDNAKEKAEEAENTPIKDAIYINNSGLVIIAPYLGMFFRKAGIVEDDKITDLTKAITLLNYISKGFDAFAEFEIVLPKLLCGLDVKDALKYRYMVTADDVAMIDELLSSIVANWPILKNTSNDTLRSTFLLRDGKLTFKDNGPRLKVQQNSLDVLLEHLPWNISMVKLPWMKNILYVEWV
ncbi:contractile injection system tape measure protein [Mucilaginibacter sp. KACC 22773]|uniref:contractile injection system tape measure protein n=1 Tax=Mucilaginibacter sp. KACC 22773 TaxID=3025671 RepID=UPI00236643DC|nr:contractile injection system tape measure protein [Mucilaginibacter sp. KACC 22773]WDF77616.1 contractile injection system tape measure protein [Mucilaginibacter sp. KACC 22773]